jgi:hypothetical protein
MPTQLDLKEHILSCHPLVLSRQRAVVSGPLRSLEPTLLQVFFTILMFFTRICGIKEESSFNSTAVVTVLRCFVAIVALSHLQVIMDSFTTIMG